jgi:hypothetical protein
MRGVWFQYVVQKGAAVSIISEGGLVIAIKNFKKNSAFAKGRGVSLTEFVASLEAAFWLWFVAIVVWSYKNNP